MKSRVFVLLYVLFSLCTLLPAQNILLQGKIKSKELHNLTTIPIRLLDSDNTEILLLYPDTLGHFTFDLERGKSYQLLVASIGIDTIRVNMRQVTEPINLGEIWLKAKTATLGEVLVLADRSVVTSMDKQIIFPSKQQLSSAINAIDVVSNLMIQGIYVDPARNKISTRRQGKLLFRINGAPAVEKDYLKVKPEQIKRVEYHDFPSMRYGDAEAVIDIILKEPIRGLSMTGDIRSAFHTLWGDGYGALSYNWRKSEIGVSLSGTVHKYSEVYSQKEERYLLRDGEQIDRYITGVPSPFREEYATMTFHYNYTNQDRSLFVAKLIYDFWNERSDERAKISDRSHHSLAPKILSKMQEKSYRELKPSFDWYYQSKLTKGLFALNLVGSAFVSESRNKVLERRGEYLDNQVMSTLMGNRYSIIGDAFWQKSLFTHNQLTLGGNYSVGFNNNDLEVNLLRNTGNRLRNHTTYLYTQWRGVYKKLRYQLGLSYTLYIQKQKTSKAILSHFVTPQLNLSLPLKSNLHLRYAGKLRVQKFSTGETTALEYPINAYLLHRGNPNLKPYTQYINQLYLTYSPKKYKFSLSVFDSYARGGITERFSSESKYVVRQLVNADKYHQLHINIGGSSSLCSGKLNVGLNGGLKFMEVESMTDKLNRLAWSYDVNVSYTLKSWKCWLSYRSDQENLSGVSLYRGNGLINVGIDYRKKNYKVSLGYISNASRFDSKKVYLGHSYNSHIYNFNDTFRNTVYVSVSFNLHSGKRFESGDRQVYNSDSDSGTLKSM